MVTVYPAQCVRRGSSFVTTCVCVGNASSGKPYVQAISYFDPRLVLQPSLFTRLVIWSTVCTARLASSEFGLSYSSHESLLSLGLERIFAKGQFRRVICLYVLWLGEEHMQIESRNNKTWNCHKNRSIVTNHSLITLQEPMGKKRTILHRQLEKRDSRRLASETSRPAPVAYASLAGRGSHGGTQTSVTSLALGSLAPVSLAAAVTARPSFTRPPTLPTSPAPASSVCTISDVLINITDVSSHSRRPGRGARAGNTPSGDSEAKWPNRRQEMAPNGRQMKVRHPNRRKSKI